MILFFGLKMTKKKNQKPIDIDLHLKYKCVCGLCHWISLIEAKTKGFKVVCECKRVFSPKRIQKIKISYVKKQRQTKKQNSVELDTIRDKCVNSLMNYGITKSEGTDLFNRAFDLEKTLDPILLVKRALSLIGDINE